MKFNLQNPTNFRFYMCLFFMQRVISDHNSSPPHQNGHFLAKIFFNHTSIKIVRSLLHNLNFFDRKIGSWTYLSKGQLISKCLFGVLTFFQKTNENKSTSSKTEFVLSFFGRNVGLKKIISNLSDLYLPAKGLEISEVTCVVHNSSKKNQTKFFFPEFCPSL